MPVLDTIVVEVIERGPQGPQVSDGDKGDITVSSNGTNWQLNAGAVGTTELAAEAVETAKIADKAVTNDKLADMAEGTFLMRAVGAGTGSPIHGTASQARMALDPQLADVDQSAGPNAVAGRVPVTIKDRFGIDVDVRSYQVKANGIDDDAAAMQRAIDDWKGQSLYVSGGVRLRVPPGTVKVTAASIDMTNAHKIQIVGSGDGGTTIKGTANQPIFTASNTSASPLYRAGLIDMTIEGPGKENTLADGVQWTANNNCVLRGVRIWSCRAGLRLSTSWQTLIDAIKIDGLGGLACYDGIYQADGELAVAENALEIRGGQIFGPERYGWRGECITGTKVFGLEVLGTGGTGVFFGSSPGNKDLKWFSWSGGLIDSCSSLLVVRKGGAALGELLHFSGLWMGYANGSDGIIAEFNGVRDVTFRPDIMVNCRTGLYTKDVTDSTFNIPGILEYNRLNDGAWGAVIENTTNCTFTLGRFRAAAGVEKTNSFVEIGTSARNTIIGGRGDNNIYTIPGNNSRVIGVAWDDGVTQKNYPDHIPEFTVAGLPGASTAFKSKLVAVTNEVGGYTLAFCDGVNWRRVQDRNIVS